MWLLRLGHKGIDCSFPPHCLGLLALEEARFHDTPLKQTYIWRRPGGEKQKPPPTASSVYQLCEWTTLTGLILHPQSSIRWLHPCLTSACPTKPDPVSFPHRPDQRGHCVPCLLTQVIHESLTSRCCKLQDMWTGSLNNGSYHLPRASSGHFIAAPQGYTVILKVQMRKLSVAGAQYLACGHMTGECQSWDSNPVRLILQSTFHKITKTNQNFHFDILSDCKLQE